MSNDYKCPYKSFNDFLPDIEIQNKEIVFYSELPDIEVLNEEIV